MKRFFLIPAFSLIFLGACTQLSPEDRKLLIDSHTQSVQAAASAKEAQESAAEAASSASAARKDAAKAAADAESAAKKADRIFRQGQEK